MILPEIADPVMASLVQEIERSLSERGIQLLLCSSDRDFRRELRAVRSLVARRVDGVLICPAEPTASRAAVAEIGRSVPVVQIGRRIDDVETSWVASNDDTAMSLVIEHLVSCGVTSAGFIGSNSRDSVSRARLAGFRRHAQRVGIEVARGNILLGSDSAEWGRESTRWLLTAGQLPEALVCAQDRIAVGAIQACQAAKVDVPEQLIITGCDDLNLADLCAPPLTTVRQPIRAMAQHAVGILRSAPFEQEPARLSLSPKLIVRESSALRYVGRDSGTFLAGRPRRAGVFMDVHGEHAEDGTFPA